MWKHAKEGCRAGPLLAFLSAGEEKTQESGVHEDWESEDVERDRVLMVLLLDCLRNGFTFPKGTLPCTLETGNRVEVFCWGAARQVQCSLDDNKKPQFGVYFISEAGWLPSLAICKETKKIRARKGSLHERKDTFPECSQVQFLGWIGYCMHGESLLVFNCKMS